MVRVLYETEIIGPSAHSHSCLQGVENMTRASPKGNTGDQDRLGLKCARRISGIAAVALFLFFSPTLVWPQTATPDEQSGAAIEQPTQQSGSTGDSTTLGGATLASAQAVVVATAPDTIPVERKPAS